MSEEKVKMVELTVEEINAVYGLVSKKIDGIAWVIENKKPKDPDGLRYKAEVLKEVLKKLE